MINRRKDKKKFATIILIGKDLSLKVSMKLSCSQILQLVSFKWELKNCEYESPMKLLEFKDNSWFIFFKHQYDLISFIFCFVLHFSKSSKSFFSFFFSMISETELYSFSSIFSWVRTLLFSCISLILTLPSDSSSAW